MEKRSIILVVLVLTGFLLSGFLYSVNVQLEDVIETKNFRISNLEDDVSGLSAQISWLEASMEDLEEENRVLEVEKTGIQFELSATEASLTSLQTEYDDLDEAYGSLYGLYQATYASYESQSSLNEELQSDLEVERVLRIGNSLESYYDSLRTGLGPTGSQDWWRNPTKSLWQTEVDFAVNLAQHDLWRIFWPLYETDYEELAGENSYVTAWYQLQNVAACIGYEYSDSSLVKIEKILDFLSENIHYETEINDVFLAPVETLGFKSGDCDDYSILAAALFEYAGIESAVGFFKNNDNQYHAMALVRLDDLGGLRHWFYNDMTFYGLPEGKWIKIEPQRTINGQGDDEWMGQWNILVAKELED